MDQSITVEKGRMILGTWQGTIIEGQASVSGEQFTVHILKQYVFLTEK
jgi:thiamine phosphate synthase YjbQ (UPF0047 family)